MSHPPHLIQRRTFLASCLAGGISTCLGAETALDSSRENAFSRIKKKLTEGKSATLLIISDSTGYKEESGTRRFVRWLSAQFPTHRTTELYWAEWTNKGATGPKKYGEPLVISEGTTGATFTVCNAVLPGSVAQAMIDGTRWESMTAPLNGNPPDLILWNHGHNNQANLPPANFANGRGSFLAPIGRVELAFPDAPQAAIIQNPWRDNDGYQRVFDWWKSVAAIMPSLTMVDGHAPFMEQSRNPQLYQDNVHPNANGYELIYRQLVTTWEKTIAKEVRPAPGWVMAQGTSLIENGNLRDWTADLPTHWRSVNDAGIRKDQEHTFAKATHSLALTGTKQNAAVEVPLSKAALAQCLGKTLSIAVLCYIPSAAEQDMQIKFTTSASDLVTGSTQNARDNWKWIVLAGCVVPAEAKFASIGLFRSFAKAPNEVPFFIQKLVVVAGDAPAGAM